MLFAAIDAWLENVCASLTHLTLQLKRIWATTLNDGPEENSRKLTKAEH